MPAFHAHVLGADKARRAVLNLGGIANLTLLTPEAPVMGFDTGPANGLMDAWCLQTRGERFDRGGQMAAAGRVDEVLLSALRADPYFALPPPKSTGREHFHLAWLQRHPRVDELPAADVQATLLALTVGTIVDALQRLDCRIDELLVCGGGVHNDALMSALARALEPLPVRSTAALGVDPDYVEAAGFAWLACRRLRRLPGNLPAVTGASGARLLGAVYAAPRGPLPG
jgi:anhydro-N-acetylmuramic acid kinase